MAAGSDILALYWAPITVWVEDELTRQVLTDIWRDPKVNVLSAGSERGVHAMVQGTPPPYRSAVFGIVDRDFGSDNKARWKDSGFRVLRLPAHEVENYLLSFEALAAASASMSEADIEKLARQHAEQLIPWTACKWLLRLMVGKSPKPPSDPPRQSIESADNAVSYLSAHPWWQEFAAFPKEWSRATIGEEIERLTKSLQMDIESGAWTRTFPGKELLRKLRSKVPGLDGNGRNTLDRDIDLGKRIALKLSSNPPADLAYLHSILRARVGLPS